MPGTRGRGAVRLRLPEIEQPLRPTDSLSRRAQPAEADAALAAPLAVDPLMRFLCRHLATMLLVLRKSRLREPSLS